MIWLIVIVVVVFGAFAIGLDGVWAFFGPIALYGFFIWLWTIWWPLPFLVFLGGLCLIAMV